MSKQRWMPTTFVGKLNLLLAAFFLGALTTFGVALVIGVSSPAPVALWSIVVPSGICGLSAFGYVLWRYHLGEPLSDLWGSIRDLWNEIGKTH